MPTGDFNKDDAQDALLKAAREMLASEAARLKNNYLKHKRGELGGMVQFDIAKDALARWHKAIEDAKR